MASLSRSLRTRRPTLTGYEHIVWTRYRYCTSSKEKKNIRLPEQCLWIPGRQFPLQLQPRLSLIVEKVLLLDPTLLHVEEEHYHAETGDAQSYQEVEGRGAVVRGRGIDDCAGDDGTEEGRGVASWIMISRSGFAYLSGCSEA